MSQTTERLNLWSANDFVLARCGFVRFIALRCMFIWCFVSTCKSPSSNSVYKIPCKNYLREIFDDCSLPSHWGFSIKNPTIESEVSWSSLLSFLHFRRTEFTTILIIFWCFVVDTFLFGWSRGLMVRESDSWCKGCEFESRPGRDCGWSECTALSLHPQYHDWGALEQDTKPSTAPRAPQAAHCSRCVFTVCVWSLLCVCVCAPWMG